MPVIPRYWRMVLLSALMACSDDDEMMPSCYSEGEVTALLNGEPWQPQEVRASNAPCFPDKVGLVVTYYNKAGFARGSFDIQNFPLRLGSYPLFKEVVCFSDSTSAFYATLEDDGDALRDVYELVEQADNYFTISAYDSLTQQLSGTFQVTLSIDERLGRSDPNAPDTIRFTGGSFRVVVELEDYSQ